MTDRDDEVRAQVRAAADELASRVPARSRARRAPVARRALVSAQLAAVIAAVVFVANQGGPTDPTGDFGADPSASATADDEPTVSPLPSKSVEPSPDPSEDETPTPAPTATEGPTKSPSPRPTKSMDPDRGPCLTPAETAAPSGIRITLTVTPTPAGATLETTLKNEGALPVKNMHGNPEADFLITGPNGEVWRWSMNKVFTMELRSDSYAPGEERSKVEAWDRTGNCKGAPPGVQPAGTYTAVGLWMTYNDKYGVRTWRSEPVTFTLP